MEAKGIWLREAGSEIASREYNEIIGGKGMITIVLADLLSHKRFLVTGGNLSLILKQNNYAFGFFFAVKWIKMLFTRNFCLI